MASPCMGCAGRGGLQRWGSAAGGAGAVCQRSGLLLCWPGPERRASGEAPPVPPSRFLHAHPRGASAARPACSCPVAGHRWRRARPAQGGGSLRPPVSEHVCARPPHGSTGVPGHEGPSDGKVGLARWPRGRQVVGRGGLQCRGPRGQRWCGTAAESGGLFLGRGPSRTDAAPSLPAAAPWPRLRFAASLSRSPVGLGASRLPGQKRSRGGTEAFCWPGPHETVTAGWRRASSVDVLASGTPLRPAPSGGSVS